MNSFARLGFYLSFFILGIGLGGYSAIDRGVIFYSLQYVRVSFYQVFLEIGGAVKNEPSEFLQEARHDGSGLIKNTSVRDGDLILLTGFFDDLPGLRLMRRDGETVANWPASFSTIFETSSMEGVSPTDWRRDIHGFEALEDGAVVFNFEYYGLVKMDRCGEVVWKIDHPTHHSVERSEKGGFWVPGRLHHDTFDPAAFAPFSQVPDVRPMEFAEDQILHVSDDGKITETVPVFDLFADADRVALMTATGVPFWMYRLNPEGELFHVNKIEELSAEMASGFPGLSAGDLVISDRSRNLVYAVDPNTWSIKWHKVGPWLRQHSPVFTDSGEIAIFNNNAVLTRKSEKSFGINPGPKSNIMLYDPATGKTRIAYGDRPGEEFGTLIRGRVEVTPGGGFIITEFEAGRAFEIDADRNVIWEYITRYDETRVAELTGAKVYPADYFTVDDWTCE